MTTSLRRAVGARPGQSPVRGADPLPLTPTEEWVLDRVRTRGVVRFVAMTTLVAVVTSLLVVTASLLILRGFGAATYWERALVYGVVTPFLVGPPLLFLTARLVAHLDTATRLLQESTVTDPLTGVANRRGFFAALDAVDGTTGVEVAMVDVDDFKAINDARGHAVGDLALCMVAAWLQELVGERGTVGRLGGDEFAYVATFDADRSPPRRQDFRVDGREFTASIGQAIAHDGDLHAALVSADGALYEQKQSRAVPPRRIVRTDERGSDQDE